MAKLESKRASKREKERERERVTTLSAWGHQVACARALSATLQHASACPLFAVIFVEEELRAREIKGTEYEVRGLFC